MADVMFASAAYTPLINNVTSSFDLLANSNEPPGNDSTNMTNILYDVIARPMVTWQAALLGTLAALTSLATIGGNLVVIASFVMERSLRQPTNFFILSLAVSDLLIGLMSMPFYTVYLLAGKQWMLGAVLCDLWLSIDYTACLASIYTVFCITVDRFCSVRIPAKYRAWRTPNRVVAMIGMTWAIPSTVFFGTIFGWQYIEGRRTVPANQCYVQYASNALFNCLLQVGYFWTTLTAMLVLYALIYKVALDMSRRSQAKQRSTSALLSVVGQTMTKIGLTITANQKAAPPTTALTPANGRVGCGLSLPVGCTALSQSTSYAVVEGNGDVTNDDLGDINDVTKNESRIHRQSGSRVPSDESAAADAVHRAKPTLPMSAGSSHIPHSHNLLTVPTSDVNASVPRPPANARTNLFCRRSMSQDRQSLGGRSVIYRCSTPPPCCMPHPEDAGTLHVNHHDNGSASSTEMLLHRPPSPVWQQRHLDRRRASDYVTDAVAGRDRSTSVDSHFLLALAGGGTRQDFSSGARRYVHRNYRRGSRPGQHANHHGNSGNKVVYAEITCSARPSISFAAVSTDSSSCSSSFYRSRVNTATAASLETLLPYHHPASTRSPAVTMDSPAAIKSSASFASAHHHHNCLKSLHCFSVSNDDESFSSSSGCKTSTHTTERSSRKNRGSILSVLARKSHQGTGGQQSQGHHKGKRESRALKALRTITIILGAFVLCWTPWHVMSLYMSYWEFKVSSLAEFLYDLSYWLCYLNSPINPFCYALANQQFRKAFVRIVRLDWHCSR